MLSYARDNKSYQMAQHYSSVVEMEGDVWMIGTVRLRIDRKGALAQ